MFLPETSHPGERGIDKLRRAHLMQDTETGGKGTIGDVLEERKEWVHPKWRPVIINPLRPLELMKSPNLFFAV